MGDGLSADLLEFSEKHRQDFPVIDQGGSLIHSDFKPVNLIWDSKQGLTVLDWEFAHSGDRLMDFSTLIRYYDEIPLNIDLFEKGYCDGGQVLPDRWIQRARVLDFLNYVQLLNSLLERPVMYQHLRDCLILTMSEYHNLDRLIRKRI